MQAPPLLSFSLLSPSVATLSNGKLQVSFPRQVLQPAMLSILHSYLKNVEYQQWLSLVHCQLLYEAILAEWDGSQSRESSAAACTITPLTGRLSLFIFPCCTWNSPGRCSPVNACHGSPGTSWGLPVWLLGPADSQLLKVWLTKGRRSNRTSQSSVSVLDLLSRVGGGLWGEEREGGRSDEAAGSCVCSICCWICLFICQPFSSRSGLNIQPVVCWSGFELSPFNLNLPTALKACWSHRRAVCTSASASVAEGSERSLPDNGA